jgi:hypothetical protein
MQSTKVRGQRKHRKQESLHYVVKWVENDTIYMRWYKRDTPAVAFLNTLTDAGYSARITTK